MHHSIAPAETLLEELFQCLRRLCPGDGRIVVFDDIAASQDTDRQITILRQCIGCEPTRLFDRLLPESPYRARHHSDGIQVGKCFTIEVLTADIFDRLPTGHQVHLVADLHIARNSADNAPARSLSGSSSLLHPGPLVVTKMHDQLRYGIGFQLGIRIDADHELRFRPADAVIQGRRLSSIGLCIDFHLRVTGKRLADFCIRRIVATVIHKNNFEMGIVPLQQAFDTAYRIHLLIVSRNDNAHQRSACPIRRPPGGQGIFLLPEELLGSDKSNKQHPADRQYHEHDKSGKQDMTAPIT